MAATSPAERSRVEHSGQPMLQAQPGRDHQDQGATANTPRTASRLADGGRVLRSLINASLMREGGHGDHDQGAPRRFGLSRLIAPARGAEDGQPATTTMAVPASTKASGT